ncbi:ParA family protein [Caldichromatium japonicum]|uniref:ParA family protein n=1 Tax=Caldichromatium japonicum TaxID=2699430 RepID=A0A6G7V9C9_9GAMM|nr:ParA family protein [Caldichromatium japonicum]QIK36673.1 ParA family protein [Caldichromatium japonicum]
MPILAVANRKGGTGKTTVAVNLAAELAARGLQVLLLDLDSQGHCAVGLGLEVKASDANLHQLFLQRRAKLANAIRPTAFTNLYLAPADPRLDHSRCAPDPDRLRQALSPGDLGRHFDLILIDTPPSLDTLFLNALYAATHVLVPYIPHYLSLEGVRQLIRALFPVMSRHNRGLKLLGFVPNQAAAHIRLHRTVTAHIGSELGTTRILPAIRADIRFAEAMAAGQPIRVYAPTSRGAEDLDRLAAAVGEALGFGSGDPPAASP